MADNRSFLACSARPNTSDRSFDLFSLLRLDRRPLPIFANEVILDTLSSLVSPFQDNSVLLLRGRKWSRHTVQSRRRDIFFHVQLAEHRATYLLNGVLNNLKYAMSYAEISAASLFSLF